MSSEFALYRKYRPQTFAHLVGQEHVRVTLLNALSEGRPVHAYLFCGPRGTGKTSTARLLAKALNCLNPTQEHEPCETCDICRDITDGRLIDLVEIDAASNRRIDEIRELRDKIHFAPTRAKNKVYIIDEVHMLTKEAFNALLKMLEEPPAEVFFILATTEVHKIPETIISRCQRFDFKRIDPKTIMTRLNYIAQLEGILIEDRAIEAIANNVDGGLRDAIGLFEQLLIDSKLEYRRVKEILGLSGHEAIKDFYKLLQAGDLPPVLSSIQELHRNGHDFSQFTKELIDFLRNEMLQAVAQKKSEEISFFMRWIEIFQQAYLQFKAALIPQLPLEMAVIKILAPAATHESSSPAISSTLSLERKLPSSHSAKKTDSSLKDLPNENSPNPPASVELNLKNIETCWPRVLELLKTPSLKQSVRNVKGFRLTENSLELQFLSKFYLEKMSQSSLRSELESAFEKITGKNIKITGVVQELQLESVASRSSAASNIVDVSDIANSASEIFGAEIVEDE